MTTLYRPVKIESAEQAEELPLGTPVWNLRPHDFVDDRGYVDTVFGERMVDTVTGRHSAAGMVGWTALVPIEAMEERGWDIAQGAPSPSARRLTTPWTIPDADGSVDEAPALADCGDQA